MRPDDPNYEYLLLIADALGELRNDVVFVGGCTAGLLLTDRGAMVEAALRGATRHHSIRSSRCLDSSKCLTGSLTTLRVGAVFKDGRKGDSHRLLKRSDGSHTFLLPCVLRIRRPAPSEARSGLQFPWACW
jgi:hypothetical protein